MTVREIIDYVQLSINDRRYWNDERLISLLNLLQMKMANDMKLVFRDFYKFESTLEQRYLLPSSLISIELIWYDNAGTEQRINVVNSPKEVYTKHSDPDTDTSDQPYKAFIWEASGRKELWIYPLFDTAGVEIWMWFYGIPPKLNTDNDTPVLHTEWHIHLIESAINRIMRLDEQITIGEEEALWSKIIHSCRSMDTTKMVMETDGKVRQDNNYPTISRGGNYSGLIDNSDAGIIWTP
jgi:hypothetical protein